MIIELNNNQFGRNVEALRRGLGYSRRKLSKLTGIPLIRLFCIEKGSIRAMDHEEMLRLSQSLKESMDKLIHSRLYE